MSFHRRIRTIYGKELIDILRDRRTLIAMIVVPIVLYPLLMLGSIQAVSYQAESMADEKFVVGTVGEAQQRVFEALLALSAEIPRGDEGSETGDQADFAEPAADAAQKDRRPLAERVRVVAIESREALERHIQTRSLHAGVVFASDDVANAMDRRNEIELLSDREEVRSNYIAWQIETLFERIGRHWVDQRKQQLRLPAVFDHPFQVTTVNLAAPSSILGQILPLVLILMTMTGAIYPAIDLTAGERERGTLESLMVCPVPVIDLIVGKFLVVTTVAIMGAALNLASVTATVYFGGFDILIASGGGGLPLGKMVFILLSLIPFAVLMSAIMIAVCSYARTFKEAQNYVTPVILAVLIPGGVAALPTTRLDGIMLVMPVGNMVLLARDLLLGVAVPAWQVVMVLFATTLYAAAAVALAARIFGQESVVFADAGSLKSTFARKLIRPSSVPTISMSLMLTALLFPVWFYVQASFSPAMGEDAQRLLYRTGALMPLLFVALPVAVLIYWKVDLRTALGWRVPSFRFLVAAVLIGGAAWVPAREITVLQSMILPPPASLIETAEAMARTLEAMPAWHVFLILAVVPAVCEELLFRGFLLTGLMRSLRPWPAILVSAAVFAVFHFVFFKFAVTAAMGVLLAYLFRRSGSIFPGMIVHLLHNGIGVLTSLHGHWVEVLGIKDSADFVHLPVPVILIGCALVGLGLHIASRVVRSAPTGPVAMIVET